MTRTKENLLTVAMVIGIVVVYGFMGNDDYHKKFDKPHVVRYNCDVLIGSWHPDVPREVIEKCRNPETRSVKIIEYKDEDGRI
jgi:hypothetical protein